MVNSNGSDLWKEIETIGPPLIKSKIPEEICINNIVSNDTQIVLDTWANKFSNLYKGISDDDPKYDQEFLYTCQNELLSQAPSTNAHTHYSLNILNEPIAQSEVKNHILVIKSKNGKTISVDGILNEILKNEQSIDMLTIIFNIIFIKHFVPLMWIQSVICPIFKGGQKDKKDPLSYQPISLISNPCKIISSILNDCSTKHMEHNCVLVEEQNGFRN